MTVGWEVLKEDVPILTHPHNDMFINAPVAPEYYFRDGLPCDYNFESLYHNPTYSRENMFGEDVSMFCNVAAINKHFNRRNVVRQDWKKWMAATYGVSR